MKRNPNRHDIYRGLVPDHLRIHWTDEDIDAVSLNQHTANPLVVRWPDRVEFFSSIPVAAKAIGASVHAISSALSSRARILSVAGAPRVFRANDPEHSQPLQPLQSGREPKIRRVIGGARVVIVGTNSINGRHEFETTREAGEFYHVAPSTIRKCAYRRGTLQCGTKITLEMRNSEQAS